MQTLNLSYGSSDFSPFEQRVDRRAIFWFETIRFFFPIHLQNYGVIEI